MSTAFPAVLNNPGLPSPQAGPPAPTEQGTTPESIIPGPAPSGPVLEVISPATSEGTFPQSSIVGSLGDLARILATNSEVSEEFLFAAALTVFGLLCCPDLQLKNSLSVSTRLYTVLLGASYEARKSTAMKRILSFFADPRFAHRAMKVLYGIGSAEGLARILEAGKPVLLAFDEFRAFMDKASIQNSTLLPMTASLYEQDHWSNVTRNMDASVDVEGAMLAMLGCCTTETYSEMWSREAIAIGFPNRLFVVNADAKPRIAWPSEPDPVQLDAIRQTILGQLAKLPVTFDITPDAKRAWEEWYTSLPASEHTKRLDVLGFRLMPLIALTTDKTVIDLETVERITAILRYELDVRTTTDPIDADNTIAKLEEAIRRQLKKHTFQSQRDLQRGVNANRHGLWAFEQALKNLKLAGQVVKTGHMFALASYEREN